MTGRKLSIGRDTIALRLPSKKERADGGPASDGDGDIKEWRADRGGSANKSRWPKAVWGSEEAREVFRATSTSELVLNSESL